jgi:hypothetical protein
MMFGIGAGVRAARAISTRTGPRPAAIRSAVPIAAIATRV